MVIDGEKRWDAPYGASCHDIKIMNPCGSWLPRKSRMSSMFLGEYQTKFTGRGRVILPKKLREAVSSNEIILSKGFEGCIWGFDKKVWEKQAQSQLEISAVEENARNLRRYLFSSSVQVEMDNQGRFVIPGSLLTYAKIKIDVILIGAGDHFEVWDKVQWDNEAKRLEKEYGRVS